jgi:membrane protein YdbS with pleckstrin-like domain
MSSEVPGPQAPEAVVARLRPHVRALILPSIALIVIVLAAGYFGGHFNELWINIAILLFAGVLIILLWVFPLLAWLGRNYTITTRRIVLRSGFLVRVRQELLHSRGYDVTVRKGALQSLFGSGDVEINSGLERPVVLRDVPDADLVQSALHDLMERSLNSVAARRQQTQSSPDETTMWGRR